MSKKWEDLLLNANSTMQDAIEVLELKKHGIAIVVDEERHLIGTITDGDIRRSLMRGLNIASPLSEIYNKSPVAIHIDDDQKMIATKMKSSAINQAPIVDDKYIVIGLEDKFDLLNVKHDNPVFLMAGGFGTRLMPLTENTPKPMLKVGGKPILEIILREFIKLGFWNFYISTHYNPDCITEFFKDGKELGVSIHYIHESNPLGTAGSLSLLPGDVNDLPLILMNGDLLTKVNFKDVLAFHNSGNYKATVCVREYDFQVPFGVTECEGVLINKIVEKPTHKFFVNAGIYVLSNDVVKSIQDEVYLDMPDLLNNLIEQDSIVSSFPIHEYWLDIGRLDDFSKAQNEVIGLFHD